MVKNTARMISTDFANERESNINDKCIHTATKRATQLNRSSVEEVKCLLFDAGLSKKFWAEAINMAAYLINRSVAASHGKIPKEIFLRKKDFICHT